MSLYLSWSLCLYVVFPPTPHLSLPMFALCFLGKSLLFPVSGKKQNIFFGTEASSIVKIVIITDEGYGFIFQLCKLFAVIQSYEFLWDKAFSLKLLQVLPYIVDVTEIQGWEETGAKILKC